MQGQSNCVKQESNQVLQIEGAIQSQQNKKSTHSQHFQQYRAFINNLSEAIPQQLVLSLNKNYISYFPEWSAQRLQIRAKSYINNLQIIEVQVVFAYFRGTITILNVETQSKIHTACEHKVGGYGRVYKIKHEDWMLALKCISFKEDNFAAIFKNTITEYFLMKIASILEVGPMIKPPFGFDIIIYKNCMEFTMEFCPCIEKDSLESDLKIALSKLHALKIIHCDIKPQNMNFSHYFNKFVFLDFGLSKIINEDIGEKSLSSFRGSLMYCGSQMESLYLTKQEGIIDLYFNDAECLRKSLLYFRQMHQYNELQGQMDHNLTDMTAQYQLFNIKWKFYKFIVFPNTNPDIIYGISEDLIELYAINIAEFIGFFPEQQRRLLGFYYKYLFKYKKQNFIKQNKNIFIAEANDNTYIQNQCFYRRFHIIEQINSMPKINFSVFQKNNETKERVLVQLERYAKLSEEKCRLKVIEFIRVEDNNNPIELKILVAKKFLEMQGKQINEGQCFIKLALNYIVATILSNPLNKYTMVTLESTIVSLFFYEVRTQQQMLQLLDNLLISEYSLSHKFKIILKFIISIKWIENKHISLYDYQELQELVFDIAQNFMERTDFTQAQPIQKLLLEITKKIIAQKASNSSRVAIRNIINSFKYERLLMLNQSFLSIIYMYVQLRQLQFILQNSVSCCKQLLSIKYQVVCQSQNKCNISICLFSKLQLYEYQMGINYLVKLFYNKYLKLLVNYPQLRHYHIFAFHKLQLLMWNKIPEQQLVAIFEEIMKKSSYQQKILIFSRLIKVYVEKKRKHNQLVGIKMINMIKQYLIELSLSTEHKRQYRFHKHKMITITRCFSQIFHLFIDFQLFKGEQVKSMITRSTNQLMSSISRQKCLKCKVQSLVQLHFLSSYIQVVDKRYENVLQLYIDLTICTLKYHQMQGNILDFLNVMLIFVHNVELQDNTKGLVQMFCEIVVSQRKYTYFFACDQNGYARLADVYLYLLGNSKIELAHMLQFILTFIRQRYSGQYAVCLINALLDIKRRTNNKQMQFFYDSHSQIIEHFNNRPFNPFVGYYYAILIRFNLQKNHKASILYKIAESINFLDSLCKDIVLSAYYLSFLHHSFTTIINKRRQLYLKKLHIKSCFLRKITLEQVAKCLGRRGKRRQRSKKKESFEGCIDRYYNCLK